MTKKRVLNELYQIFLTFFNFKVSNSRAKGSMDIADTITDSSVLKGYLMSGTYIRPFSVDFMLTYSF